MDLSLTRAINSIILDSTCNSTWTFNTNDLSLLTLKNTSYLSQTQRLKGVLFKNCAMNQKFPSFQQLTNLNAMDWKCKVCQVPNTGTFSIWWVNLWRVSAMLVGKNRCWEYLPCYGIITRLTAAVFCCPPCQQKHKFQSSKRVGQK